MQLFKWRELRRTTLISVGMSALLVGLFLAYYGFALSMGWLILVPIFIFGFIKLKKARLVMVLLLGLLLGMWRGTQMFHLLQKYQSLYGTKQIFSAYVQDDVGFNEQRNQYEFHIHDITNKQHKLPGRIQISTREDLQLTRGDIIVVTGKLKEPIGTSRQGSISFAQVKILQKNTSFLEQLRARFFTSVKSALPEPQASLGLGYLVGLRVSIPKELSDQLAVVGLTHVIAVSGYNLTIIVEAVRRLFGKNSAYQSVLFSGLLIVTFLLIAGSSAPITRAAVVCGFSLAAWYYGKAIKPVVLLLLSGALTAFVNPLYVWGDPGWYLSFLAFAGVLILAPLIVKRLFKNKTPPTMLQILIETLCAQACTIPYTLFLFGGVSVIAPVANVLVLPFIPFIMLLVFLLGIIGMVVPSFALYVGLIPSSLLTLQVWLVETISAVSGAYSELTLTAVGMVGLFGVLLAIIVILSKVVSKANADLEPDHDLL